jgi:hypothetical protein
VSPAAREIAASLGYCATTGGTRRNTAGDPAAIVSRIHAGDRALGVRWAPAEKLRLRATIGLFEGNHYWYLIAGPMDLARRLVAAARRRFPRLAKRVPSVPSRDSRKSPPSPSVTT